MLQYYLLFYLQYYLLRPVQAALGFCSDRVRVLFGSCLDCVQTVFRFCSDCVGAGIDTWAVTEGVTVGALGGCRLMNL